MTNIVLVYPLIFLVTSISVFFRPARVAILPQIVPEEDLLSANSALWVGETIADVIGYPLAGVFVCLLGIGRPDRLLGRRATYLASAAPDRDDRRPGADASAVATTAGQREGFVAELVAPAGTSSGASRCCWRTRSRAPSASSASASPSR